jgi:hypothetical protein
MMEDVWRESCSTNKKTIMRTKEEILSGFNSKDAAWWAYREGVQTGYNEAYYALRNQAAIAAMQGMVSCGEGAFSYKGIIDDIAKSAVDYADSLIEELKKK